jgi:hypothetical protein
MAGTDTVNPACGVAVWLTVCSSWAHSQVRRSAGATAEASLGGLAHAEGDLMKKRSLVLVALVFAFTLAFAGAAVALPIAPTPAPLQIGFSYDGSTTWFGATGAWTNQDFSIVGTPTIYAPTPAAPDALGYRFNDGPLVDITADWKTHKFSSEGMYRFDAVLTTVGVTYESSNTVMGLDKHRPWSWSSAVPVYDSPAVITITASDTLSGAAFVAYSLDGAQDYNSSYSPFLGAGALTTTVTVTTPGKHTMKWFSVDRAGNHEYTHEVAFQVNAPGYTPRLSKPYLGGRGRHYVRISGSVTKAATARNLYVRVQRKVAGVWMPDTVFKVAMPKYAGSYSIKKWIGKDGTYRVIATEGAGTSSASRSVRIR